MRRCRYGVFPAQKFAEAAEMAGLRPVSQLGRRIVVHIAGRTVSVRPASRHRLLSPAASYSSVDRGGSRRRHVVFSGPSGRSTLNPAGTAHLHDQKPLNGAGSSNGSARSIAMNSAQIVRHSMPRSDQPRSAPRGDHHQFFAQATYDMKSLPVKQALST